MLKRRVANSPSSSSNEAHNSDYESFNKKLHTQIVKRRKTRKQKKKKKKVLSAKFIHVTSSKESDMASSQARMRHQVKMAKCCVSTRQAPLMLLLIAAAATIMVLVWPVASCGQQTANLQLLAKQNKWPTTTTTTTDATTSSKCLPNCSLTNEFYRQERRSSSSWSPLASDDRSPTTLALNVIGQNETMAGNQIRIGRVQEDEDQEEEEDSDEEEDDSDNHKYLTKTTKAPSLDVRLHRGHFKQLLDLNSGHQTDVRAHHKVYETLDSGRRTKRQLASISSTNSRDTHDSQTLPAHSFSLAKKRLLHKSEPSMINSALINGKANLVCDIQAPSADDSVALILWYKDDSLAPIYTVDARKANSLDKAKISADEQYSARLNFNTRTQPAQLELRELSIDDEGEYRCRVDFKRGRTVNTLIQLRIVVPPSDLSIYLLKSATSQQQQQQLVRLASTSGAQQTAPTNTHIGPFDEGAQLELVCVATGGRPRAQLSWRRDFNSINSTGVLSPATFGASLANNLNGASDTPENKDTVSAVLKINPLTREHLLSVFTCQASSGATNVSLGAQPMPTINQQQQPTTLLSSITLDLNLKPQEVRVRQVMNGMANNGDAMLVVGQSATFECTTSGSRPEATIHWLFQGQRHDSPMSVEQQQHTSSRLTLVLQRSFNGQQLICVAENGHISSPGASAKQTAIKLDVHYPPQVRVTLENELDKNDDDADADVMNGGNLNDNELSTKMLTIANSLQEGNDIYLTCQVDANPRPVKGPIWRHNGRVVLPSTMSMTAAAAAAAAAGTRFVRATTASADGTIVISNQSLVLRKVSRNQSGAYTCETSNAHGTSISKPLELRVRHAPVCVTDDILVYEATAGQVVTLECPVHANPSKSVHFSWFAATTASHGYNSSTRDEQVAAWLQRDASLDEQLDESSSQQLKFKLTNGTSFALIKCRAKNEIGLQQRACAFQVLEANTTPELRHSCSLAGASSASLQIECKLSEHLKTSSSELQQRRRQNEATTTNVTTSSYNWMRNLHAIKQQQNLLASGQQAPVMRFVYPPDWLLVELYAPHNNSTSSSDWTTATTTTTTQDSLHSYVIVSVASQLARVKSIIEENKLFSSNPRDIYYVAARPQQQQQAVATNNTTNATTTEQPIEPLQLWSRHQYGEQRTQNKRDASIQLAPEFNFTIPNLTPDSEFKLVIYGQNLVNKTRDSLLIHAKTMLRAEQQQQQVAQQQQQQQPSIAYNQQALDMTLKGAALEFNGEQAVDNSGEQFAQYGNNKSLRQKSLVMRSDSSPVSGEQQQENGVASQQRDQQQQQQQQQPQFVRFVGGSSTLLAELSTRIKNKTRDYMSQAPPLLSVPIVLIACVCIAVLLVYMSGQFVGLVRRRRQQARGQQADTSSGSSANGLGATGSFNSDDCTPTNESRSSTESIGSSSKAKMQQQQQQQEKKQKFVETQRVEEICEQANHEQTRDLSPATIASSTYSSSLLANAPLIHHHHHQHLFAATQYAADPHDGQQELLDVVALEQQVADWQLGRAAGEARVSFASGCERDWLVQQQQQQQQQQEQHFMGSLDRRTGHLLLGVGTNEHLHLAAYDNDDFHQHQPTCRRFSSIDRRRRPPATASGTEPLLLAHHHHHHQDQHQINNARYQPLFIAPPPPPISNELQQQQPAPKPRTTRRNTQTSGAQHRVAFDLSNQRGQQQHSCSSGSNNTTGDSGRDSPGTTNEMNNSTSNNSFLMSYATPDYHSCGAHVKPSNLKRRQATSTTTPSNTNFNSNNQQPVQMLLVEFASPSSQESTLLHSVDSIATNEQQSMSPQLATNFSTKLITAKNENHDFVALEQNHQMATSFTSARARE